MPTKMQTPMRQIESPGTVSREARAGAATVEAAFVLPIVLLFIMGLFEYGRYYLMVHVCDNAVSAGAAYACKHTSPIVISGTTYGNGRQRRHQRRQRPAWARSNLPTRPSTFTCRMPSAMPWPTARAITPDSFTNAGVGQYICVQLTGTYTFVPAS